MDSLGWVGFDPARSWNENSSLGLSIPYITLGQASAHPNEAMNSIKTLHLTAARILVSRDSSSLKRAAAGELGVIPLELLRIPKGNLPA